MILLTEGKTNWKYILIVLILAVIVGGGVLWWIKKEEVAPIEFPEIKKPEKVVEDETANWKVYKDEVYGFEIKYPKDWTIEEAKIEEAKEIVKRYLSFSPMGKTYILGGMGNRQPISILVSKGGIEAYRSIYPKKEGAETIIVNNYSTIREERDFGEIFYIIQNPEDDTVVTFENWIQVIEDLIKPSEKKELENIFDQMLSTFRFLEEVKKSEIISLDNTWNKYINYRLGFSMKIPKTMPGLNRCGDPGGTEIDFSVPIKAFDDNENNAVYISQEYYYDAEWDSEQEKEIGPCEKITYSLGSLRADLEPNSAYAVAPKPFLGWAIFVKNINSDTELNKFVKEVFCSKCNDCYVVSKKPWTRNQDYYEVLIEGGGMEDSNCPLNYAYKVIYAPEKHKAMAVSFGQECSFYNKECTPTGQGCPLPPDYKCYDEEMINSFKFK